MWASVLLALGGGGERVGFVLRQHDQHAVVFKPDIALHEIAVEA